MEERALVVLTTMLRARGYKFDAHEQLGNPLDETKMYNFGGALVIFSDKTRISKQELQNYITFAAENGYTNGTIIVSTILPSDDVLSGVRKYISDRSNPMLQVFDYRHVQFDITTHQKAFPHRILPEDEKAEIEKRFKSIAVLPLLDSQDAMAKWIGARPGDVVEITRSSPSAGKSLYWRQCVADNRRAR